MESKNKDEPARRANLDQREEDGKSMLIYNIDDRPPAHLALLFIFQQVVLATSSILMAPVIITQMLGEGRDDDEEYKRELLSLRAQLISVSMFASGISTVLQVTFGIRLPLMQGSSYTFLPVILTIIRSDKYKTQDVDVTSSNTTRVIWQEQLQEISGSLMAATSVQIILGALGVVGFLARYIGPLTIAPILMLLTLGFIDAVTLNCSYQWGIAAMSALLVVFFGEILGTLNIPLPVCKKGQGCKAIRLPLFNILPIFMSIGCTWALCGILTASDVFPRNATEPAYMARTDSKLYLIGGAEWVAFPYPGRWGWPTISLAGFIGMFAATISSIIESIGDYHASAKLCGVTKPPPHALNRGILVEGIGSMVAAILFAGHGTTSYSDNIGTISITRVGSRFVFQCAGIALAVMGILGKFGAAMATIPEPIIGGILIAVVGIVMSVAIDMLSHVNLNESRNQVVLGMSVYAGVVVPRWIRANSHVIQTGNILGDQLIQMILGTEIIFGGFLAFLFDMILPGSRADRGMESSAETLSQVKSTGADQVYSFPRWCRCSCLSVCRYLPFMPDFEPSCCRGRDTEVHPQNTTIPSVSNSLKFYESTKL